VAALGGVLVGRRRRLDRPLDDVRAALGAGTTGGQRSNAHGDARVIVGTETPL
jgi:hypothetical protein